MINRISPMLATSAEPFDSFEYAFEIKWDGVRALAAVEDGQWRLWGRDLADYTPRYPELDVLRRLPSGTIVDGELVAFRHGRPDLNAILGRHQLLDPMRIRFASRQIPVRFVLFDLLYHQGRTLLHEPFYRRRRLLVDLLTEHSAPLMFSEGIAGSGEDFFERAVALGHEGIMAKLQTSRYLPGQRSSAWKKIKADQMLVGVIVGCILSRGGVDSVLVATCQHGALRYVGQVSSGFSDQAKAELAERLARLRRPQPVIACPGRALWVRRVQRCTWDQHGWSRSGSTAYSGVASESIGP
jgi:bifunctional non-homologous end joining protein LigD